MARLAGADDARMNAKDRAAADNHLTVLHAERDDLRGEIDENDAGCRGSLLTPGQSGGRRRDEIPPRLCAKTRWCSLTTSTAAASTSAARSAITSVRAREAASSARAFCRSDRENPQRRDLAKPQVHRSRHVSPSGRISDAPVLDGDLTHLKSANGNAVKWVKVSEYLAHCRKNLHN